MSGYKSLYGCKTIEIRPLTILAGANSSGKSSIFQPLLLLKQTLEVSFDPGALLLNGPNVKFTSTKQVLSHNKSNEDKTLDFSVKVSNHEGSFVDSVFTEKRNKGFEIKEMRFGDTKKSYVLVPESTHTDIVRTLSKDFSQLSTYEKAFSDQGASTRWVVARDRCFLEIGMEIKRANTEVAPILSGILVPNEEIRRLIREVIHIPGLRGNPARTYPVTAVAKAFSGTFENYVASIIYDWQENSAGRKNLSQLGGALQKLGLTWKVSAKRINDTQVELQVGILPSQLKKKKSQDMVNIADVGFGVSQTLPFLVALLVASRGQLVYVEQPEIHLHPKAQFILAEVVADAVKRGVQVVIETHSSIFLLGVQALIAEDKLSPDLVKLHWFAREEDGETQISSANLDDTGAFGDWPEDFDEVTLKAQDRYLIAAENKVLNSSRVVDP